MPGSQLGVQVTGSGEPGGSKPGIGSAKGFLLWSSITDTQAILPTRHARRGTPISARAGGELVEDPEHRLRPGTDPVVLGQIPPADGAGRVDQELRRPGDISCLSRVRMKKVVAADGLGLRVTQDGKRPAGLREVLAIGLGRIDADRDGPDAASLEFGEPFLETP